MKKRKFTDHNNKSNYVESLKTPIQRSKSASHCSYFEGESHHEEHEQKEQAEKMNNMVKELVVKNKINAKNAFQVPIIDVTTLQAIKQNSEGSWNSISNTLENSSKIYGLRVDFMSDNVNKIINLITRSSEMTSNLDHTKEQRSEQAKANPLKMEHLNNNEGLKENLEIHLDERLKKEQMMIELRSNEILLGLRRMFDQNGVSGLMLNNLPIKPSLNIEIKADIVYEAAKANNCNFQSIQLVRDNQITIFSQISKINELCFKQQSKNDNEVPYHESQYCYYEERCYKDQFQFTAENAEIDPMDNQFFYHTNILADDFIISFIEKSEEQEIKGQKIVIKNKIRGKQVELGKKKKFKRQKRPIFEVKFDESIVMDIKQVMKRNVSQRLMPLKRYRKKFNHKQIQFSDFYIQKRLSYVPQALQEQKIAFETHDLDYSVINGSLVTKNQSNQVLLKAPNIKNTKNTMAEIIKNFPTINYDTLHSQFEVEIGILSEAIGFLSVLHLCNENNLELQEIGNGDLTIINPNFGRK